MKSKAYFLDPKTGEPMKDEAGQPTPPIVFDNQTWDLRLACLDRALRAMKYRGARQGEIADPTEFAKVVALIALEFEKYATGGNNDG